MKFDILLTTEQVRTLSRWIYIGEGKADVLLAQGERWPEGGRALNVAQGDARAIIYPDGMVSDED